MFSMRELTHEGGFGCSLYGGVGSEKMGNVCLSGTVERGGRAVGTECGRTLLFDKGSGEAGGC